MGFPEHELQDRRTIGFGQGEFRRNVKAHGGAQLSEIATRAAPVLNVLKAFRDPLIHGAGLAGTTWTHIGALQASEARAAITPGQRQALEGLGKKTGRPERWGLRWFARDAQIDPVAFVDRLAVDGLALLDEFFSALGDDLGIAADLPDPTLSGVNLRQLRLLHALDPDQARLPSP